jgi:hypothetical protein
MPPEAQRWYEPDSERKQVADEADYTAEIAALLRLRRELAAIRAELTSRRRLRSMKAGFNPDQPRDDHGRWTDTDGDADTSDAAAQGDVSAEAIRIAQAGFGTLIAEIPVPGGRRCVYGFVSVRVVVPGPISFPCAPRAHWSAVTHGTLLNDN